MGGLNSFLRFAFLSITMIACTSAYLHHNALRAALAFHGWDRTVQITVVQGKPKVSLAQPTVSERKQFFAAPFGWSRLMSAEALTQLQSLPTVESMHRALYYQNLLDEQNRQTSIAVVESAFITAFGLGVGAELSTDLSIAASSLKAAQRLIDDYPQGTLVLRRAPDPFIDKLGPNDADKLPAAEQRLSTNVFTPLPLSSAGVRHFFAAAPWADSEKLRASFVTPFLTAMVKLRPAVRPEEALAEIQGILDQNPTHILPKGWVAQAAPVLDTRYIDKTQRALLDAGHWIPVAVVLVFALIVFTLTWLRFRAILLELALRRGFGQGKWPAVWLTLRPPLTSLVLSMLAAFLLAWVWFAVQGHVWAAPQLWPAAGLGAALGAGLALLLARALVRPPVALLIKGQTA